MEKYLEKKVLLMFCSLLSINVLGQIPHNDTIEFSLYEYEMNNSIMMQNMNAIIHFDSILFERDANNVFITYISKITDNEFNIYVISRPLFDEDERFAFGFIEYKNSIYILVGDYIENCFSILDNKRKFEVIVSNDNSDINIPAIDYIEWPFYYNNKRFYFRLNYIISNLLLHK